MALAYRPNFKTFFIDNNTPVGKKRQVSHSTNLNGGDAGNSIGNLKLEITKGRDVGLIAKFHFNETKLIDYGREAIKHLENNNLICCHLGGQDSIIGAGKYPEGVLDDRPSWIEPLNATVEDIETIAGTVGSQILNVDTGFGGSTEAVLEGVEKLLPTFKYVTVWLPEPSDKLSRRNMNYYLSRFENLGKNVRTIFVKNPNVEFLYEFGNSIIEESIRLGCAKLEISDFFRLLKPISVLTTEAGYTTPYRSRLPFSGHVFDPNETYDALRKIFRKLPVKSEDDFAIIAGDITESIMPKLKRRLFQSYKFELEVDKFQFGIDFYRNIFVGLFQSYEFPRERWAVADEHDFLIENDP